MDADERGISNALNIILLVGLALLVGFLVVQFAFSNFSLFDAGPSARFAFETTGDDLEITFERGERVDGSQVLVVRSDRAAAETWAGSACAAPVSELTAGATCVVPGGASAESVLVVWRSDEGREYVVGRWRQSRGGVGLPVGDVDSGSGSGSGGSDGSDGSGSGGDTDETDGTDGSGSDADTDASGGSGSVGGSGGSGSVGDGGSDDDGDDTGVETFIGTGSGESRFSNGSAWRVEGRYGGDDTWELAADDDTVDHEWTNGTVEPFRLTYDGEGNVTFRVGNETVRAENAMAPDGGLVITVAVDDDTGTRTVSIIDLRLNDRPLREDSLTRAAGTRHLYVADAATREGFVLTGQIQFVWTGSDPEPDDMRVTVYAEA